MRHYRVWEQRAGAEWPPEGGERLTEGDLLARYPGVGAALAWTPEPPPHPVTLRELYLWTDRWRLLILDEADFAPLRASMVPHLLAQPLRQAEAGPDWVYVGSLSHPPPEDSLALIEEPAAAALAGRYPLVGELAEGEVLYALHISTSHWELLIELDHPEWVEAGGRD